MIELIHPPHFNSTDDRLDPPLGLLFIATALGKYTDVRINDLSGIKNIDEIKIGYADIYGITVYCSTIKTVKEIINKCKKINPKSLIVTGGAHITTNPNAVDCDFAVRGYGEDPMLQLIGEKEYTPFEVDWSLIDVLSYHRTINGEKSLPVLTSIGCPYKCSFCGLNAMHKLNNKVIFDDPEHVIDNFKKIKDAGINALNIQDDIFTLRHDRLKKILAGIKKLDMPFRCMGRAGHDTEDTYKMLADAGCKGVAWGIESGNQTMLDRMNKQVSVIDNYNVIQWCKKYGMDSRAFFVLGFPGETPETITETFCFIINSDPDQYFISNFIPYPGTDVWNNPKKYGIINMSKNFGEYYQVSKDGSGGAVIDTEWMSREELKKQELDLRELLSMLKPLRGKNKQEYEKINNHHTDI